MAGTPGNALNISAQGTVYFNGIATFSEIDGSTANKVLTSNGTGAAPSFQNATGGGSFSTINYQVFTALGASTYTPTANMKYVVIECIGAGGGGGGVAVGVAEGAAGGGGAGGYSKGSYSAATIGASKTVTIGTGGTAGANTGGTGGTGGTSSVGSLISCTGGVGGGGAASVGASPAFASGGAGGVGSSGSVNITSQSGYNSFIGLVTSNGYSGAGASGIYGGGGSPVRSSAVAGDKAGVNASGFGAGGSGGDASVTSAIGGVGSNGYVIIQEFI